MNLSLNEWDGKHSSTNKEAINSYPKIMTWKVWTAHQKLRTWLTFEWFNKLTENHQILCSKKLITAAVNGRYKNYKEHQDNFNNCE